MLKTFYFSSCKDEFYLLDSAKKMSQEIRELEKTGVKYCNCPQLKGGEKTLVGTQG